MSRGEVGWIYTIHLHTRLGGPGRNGAVHYTGWARDLLPRLRRHLIGSDARIMAWCAANGIRWHVGALRRGTRDDERRLKRQHSASRWCWTCQAATLATQRAAEWDTIDPLIHRVTRRPL